MIKRVVLNPFTPIPKSEKSHVRGWSMIWAQRLNADIATKDTDLSGYDEIYIDHGVNFNGALNLFGGFNDEVIDRCNILIERILNGAKLYSLDWKMSDIDYPTQISKRIGKKSSSDRLTSGFLDVMTDTLGKAKFHSMANLNLSSAILGDSHSPAYSLPNMEVYRTNGKLLYSFLNGKTNLLSGNIEFKKDKPKWEEIYICLGSIDIRFHVYRHKTDPLDLADKYLQKIDMIKKLLGVADIIPCAPVPIEWEGRKIPGTGMYKGKPFYGSLEFRQGFTNDFISYLERYIDVLSPPEEWYNMGNEKYAKEIMEMGSSVHIAPKNYNSIIGW
jgi:hypothetical protein